MAVLIGFHATCATIALLLGAAVLLRRVKGDRLHRLAGRTWVATMYVARSPRCRSSGCTPATSRSFTRSRCSR